MAQAFKMTMRVSMTPADIKIFDEVMQEFKFPLEKSEADEAKPEIGFNDVVADMIKQLP